MGIIRKIITYAIIGAFGIGIGNYTARCGIERKYELVPKNTIEKKIEQNIEYIKSDNENTENKNNDYNFVIDKYGK